MFSGLFFFYGNALALVYVRFDIQRNEMQLIFFPKSQNSKAVPTFIRPIAIFNKIFYERNKIKLSLAMTRING